MSKFAEIEIGLRVETVETQNECLTVNAGHKGTVIEANEKDVRVEFDIGETLYVTRDILKVIG